MGIGADIERIDDRLDAIEAALRSALPRRIVTRSLKHYDEHSPADLRTGVVTLVSAGESQYDGRLGMEATRGTLRILLVGHLKVEEESGGVAIEAAELDLVEDIKAFVRGGVTGMSLRLDNVQHSRQLEHPYGWLVAYVDVGPGRDTY